MPGKSTVEGGAKLTSPPFRSPCPVACCLDLFGDRWTLLVIRDLMLGRTRFKEFAASPERIPTNLLSDRLDRLVANGLARRVAPAGGKRFAYELTEKGEALRPVLLALKDWGLRWQEGTRAELHREPSGEGGPGLP